MTVAEIRPEPAEPQPAFRFDRVRRAFSNLSLTSQFLLTNLVVFVIAMVLVGAWIGQQIEASILERTASEAAIYVNSVITPHLQKLGAQPALDEADMAELDGLSRATLLGQQVVAVKVWSVDGEILYSPNRALVGQRFDVDAELADSLTGAVTADLTDLQDPENIYERERWPRLLQVYAPVRQDTSGAIIAVTEFYQPPDELDAEVAGARLRAWALIATLGGLAYLLLAGIVKRASDTIARQDVLLRQQLGELSVLHERVRTAAVRTTTLNEQALRRISADLHDGPGQALALALLRLDSLHARPDCSTCSGAEEFGVVHGAIRDALAEIRSISAGLRLPEIQPLSVEQVAERAVHDHERRARARVELRLTDAPEHAPLAIKIALLRTLQEALSNATRHTDRASVLVELRGRGDELELTVTDRGPGFRPADAAQSGRLGLVGMRERAELLGGSFSIRSAPGQGTVVYARWPLADVQDTWATPA